MGIRVLGGIADLILAGAVFGQTASISGSATYRERMALPAEAVFEATLEDVSRADAAADVVARVRTEKPGQPPFSFSIPYDPTKIVEGRSYVVRARVMVRATPMFATDRVYPVLTRGHGQSAPMMLMRRVRASGATIRDLPASFRGQLPCADCAGIEHVLNLFPDSSFYLRRDYSGRTAVDDMGRWQLSADGSTLTLAGSSRSLFEVRSADVLRMLDQQGKPIQSGANYELKRMASFERLQPRLAMSGMFRLTADAPTFTDCATGQRWPVAMEREYRAAEAAYLKTRRQSDEALLATLSGEVAMRPNADTGAPAPTLVIEKYDGMWPGESCSDPLAASLPLEKTEWRLTRLTHRPVVPGARQTAPKLSLQPDQSRVAGSSGCNSFSGAYSLKGDQLAFGRIAATRRACIDGMETENLFLQALEKVRGWKISGRHLELLDERASSIARFEAAKSK